MKRGRHGAAPPGRATDPAASAPLTEEQEGWIERGMKTVARCARSHARRSGGRVTYEELLSLGSIGLMQAVRTYRPDSATDFEVYCYKRVDGAMRYGLKKERQFYALLWEAGYTHLETTRDEGPAFEGADGDGDGDVTALHAFSDRLVTAVARKLCGSASMMEAATSEEAVARRQEWSRRMHILVDEIEQTPQPGKDLLQLVYDEGLTVKEAGAKLDISYGQARSLRDRTLDDLGARVRRRCTFDPGD